MRVIGYIGLSVLVGAAVIYGVTLVLIGRIINTASVSH